jgi:hypothetical protein
VLELLVAFVHAGTVPAVASGMRAASSIVGTQRRR